MLFIHFQIPCKSVHFSKPILRIPGYHLTNSFCFAGKVKVIPHLHKSFHASKISFSFILFYFLNFCNNHPAVNTCKYCSPSVLLAHQASWEFSLAFEALWEESRVDDAEIWPSVIFPDSMPSGDEHSEEYQKNTTNDFQALSYK